MGKSSRAPKHLNVAHQVFVPTIVLGELFFGAAKSSRPTENQFIVERFATGRSILVCGLDVAREYGRVKDRLRARGRPIPENDIWIAATAKHHGMILVTRDRHFQEVAGLETVDWSN